MERAIDWTQRQSRGRSRGIKESPSVDCADDRYARRPSRSQRKKHGWFGVEALCEIGLHLDKDLRNALDSGPIGQRTYETVEMEAPIVDARSRKRGGVARSCRGYAKAVIAQEGHCRNTKMMVFASDIEQMGLQGAAFRHRRPIRIVMKQVKPLPTIVIQPVRSMCIRHLSTSQERLVEASAVWAEVK